MKITALVEALVTAGATPEMILAAVRTAEAANEDALEQARAKTRARVEKWRAKKAGNVTHDIVTGGNNSRGGDARVEDNLLPKKIEPQEEKKENAQARDLSEFREALSDLDDERLAALVKHRRSKRAQNTGHAARLFRRDAAACGLSMAEAVDTCISRNWITVKPEWLAKPQVRGSPPKPTLASAFGELSAELRQQREIQSRAGDGGIRPPVLDLPAIRHG